MLVKGKLELLGSSMKVEYLKSCGIRLAEIVMAGSIIECRINQNYVQLEYMKEKDKI